MSSLKPGKSTLSRNDDGFTLLEIMVGLAILSLIGVVVWQGIAHTGRLFEKISSSLFSTVRTVQMDQYLREETAKIKAPFWIKGFQVHENGGQSLSIPYMEGDPDRFLVFEYKGEYLHIGETKQGSEVVDTMLTFGPFKEVAFETAKNEREQEYGIKFSVSPGNSPEVIEIVARFGSNPF
jgi:prepilin-type N-terminal cleavage/methylation domain-containing protein